MSCRVYVGHLPYSARERDVERFFRGFGRLREVNLKNGFCFVEFEDPRDADDAVYEMNGREMLGERVVVEHSRGPGPRGRGSYGGGGGGYGGGGGGYRPFNRNRSRYGPPVRTDYRVTVENLSSRVSWQDLKDFLRPVAEVTYADAHKQRIGEGVVEFRTREDMERAIRKLDGTELNGRKITLIEDTSSSSHRSGGRSRRSRSRSRSRSRRSRSRSHSRSRSRRSRSRSRSSGKRSRSRSRSKSASRDRSKSRERSREHSRDRSRSGSRDRSRERSRERSRSRSGSPVNGERGQSGEPSSPADRPADNEQSPGNDQTDETEQVQDEEESKQEEEAEPAADVEQEDMDNES